MTQRTTSMGTVGALALVASLVGGCLFEVPFGKDRPDGAVPDGGAAAACRPSGCSGQICADTDQASTCEWNERYACYRSATCERQSDGHCGWTPTAELTACLAGGGSPDGGVTPPVCRTSDGRTLAVGETYNDGCNDCTCTESGSIACTRRACVDGGVTPPVCRTPDGRALRVGESYFDGCNTCACQANGLLACTLRACADAGSPAACRTPDGRTLSVGERYYDGCNYCTSGADGSFSCTERACPDAGIPVDACHPTGCSGQICAENDVPTTCEWREQYACYRSATCARQADGLCGWTQTPELRACLAAR